MLLEKHCWAEVDLDALAHNFRLLQQHAGSAAVCAVVKAGAYGHGDGIVCRTLAAARCPRGFAVSPERKKRRSGPGLRRGRRGPGRDRHRGRGEGKGREGKEPQPGGRRSAAHPGAAQRIPVQRIPCVAAQRR